MEIEVPVFICQFNVIMYKKMYYIYLLDRFIRLLKSYSLDIYTI